MFARANNFRLSIFFQILLLQLKKFQKKNDNLRKDIVYTAESDYGIWTPVTPMAPYHYTGYGKTVEEAVSEALSTFDEDIPLFPNEQVFITDATGDYNNATFIDGTGKQVSYATAHKIVSDAYEKLLNLNTQF